MDNLALLGAIGIFFGVFFSKKISPLSLYTLFGLEWSFYLLFPYLSINKLMPPGLPPGAGLNNNKEVMFYFFIFNALFLVIFSLMYWLFYRTKPAVESKEIIHQRDGSPYRGLLFWTLSLLSAFLIVLSIKFPYLKYNWIAHSINANTRNIFVALFFYYMLLEPKRWRVYLIFFLFAVSTLLWGGRLYLAIMMAGFFFYLFNIKVLDLKKVVVLFLLMVTFFSLIGVLRSGTAFDKIGFYLWYPLALESEYSSYPGLAVIDLWRHNEIHYYTYFGSYFVDPIMIFVPQAFFIKEDIGKSNYNILGNWERDHGGRDKISPAGAYCYLAEAMEAAGVYGVMVVALCYGLICIYMEKLLLKGTIGQFLYYTFVGTFGFGFAKNQFSWCFRYFMQSVLALMIFLAVLAIMREGAANLKNSRLRLAGKTAK